MSDTSVKTAADARSEHLAQIDYGTYALGLAIAFGLFEMVEASKDGFAELFAMVSISVSFGYGLRQTIVGAIGLAKSL